jgi:hypothetical protein
MVNLADNWRKALSASLGLPLADPKAERRWGTLPLGNYHKKAEECRRMAAEAGSPPEKEAWLKLAADWLALIRNYGSERSDEGR